MQAVMVTLGDMPGRAERDLASGKVVRAGLRALDREEAANDALLPARVADAIARSPVAAADAFTLVRGAIASKK